MTSIAVVGSVNLDLIASTSQLPRPGETVLGRQLTNRTGGKGANQAVAAVCYGADVSFLGTIGDDAFGESLRADLTGAALSTDFLQVRPGTASGVAVILVDDDGENMITVAPGANWTLSPADVARFSQRIITSDALLVQLEVPPATVAAAIETAGAAGVLTVLNAAPVAPQAAAQIGAMIGLVDVLLVNQTEAAALGAQGATWAEMAHSLLSQGPRLVVMTLGDKGAVAATNDQVLSQAAFPVKVVDAVGAGDAFSAALTVELARHATLEQALQRASAAAALATTGAGAQAALPSYQQVTDYLASHRSEVVKPA